MKKWFVGLSLVLSSFLIKEAMFPRVYVETSALSHEPFEEEVLEEAPKVVPATTEVKAVPVPAPAPIPEPVIVPVEKPRPPVAQPQAPVEPPMDNSKEELLRQVTNSSLVSCQTQIKYCEPKNESTEMSNPEQDTFCVTFANNCSDRNSIQRIFSEEEVFPPRENSNFVVDQDPAPINQDQNIQDMQPGQSPYPENPYNDPNIPGYQQPVENNPYDTQPQDPNYNY